MLDATEMMRSHPSFLAKTFRKVRSVCGLQDVILDVSREPLGSSSLFVQLHGPDLIRWVTAEQRSLTLLHPRDVAT